MKNISLILNNKIKQLIAKDMGAPQKCATANLISHFNAQTANPKKPMPRTGRTWTQSPPLDRHK